MSKCEFWFCAEAEAQLRKYWELGNMGDWGMNHMSLQVVFLERKTLALFALVSGRNETGIMVTFIFICL